MPRKADDQDDWLQRAIVQPDFRQHLALAASGAGGVVFDHIDEAAHSWLAAVVCQHLTSSGKKRLWLVCDAPRQRERLAAELELWGIDAADLPEMPSRLSVAT